MDTEEKEMTLREMIEMVKDFVLYIWKKKFIIIPIALICGLLGFFYAKYSMPKYSAKMTFMVKEDGSGSVGGVSSILGMLGIGSKAGKFNLDKVVALSKSQNIIRKTLLDTVEVDGRKEILANYMVEKMGLKEGWKETPNIISQFESFSGSETFSLPESEAFKRLFNIIAGEKNKNRLFSSGFDEFNTIFTFVITSQYDTLSYLLTQGIFNNLQDFYIFQSIQQPLVTVQQLEKRVATVEGKMKKGDYSLASTKDQTIGLWKEQDAVPEKQISRDINVNTIVYGELLKNLEAARFTLQTSTPVFQVIDQPFYPITKAEKSILFYTLLGIILGCGIIAFILLIGRVIKGQ